MGKKNLCRTWIFGIPIGWELEALLFFPKVSSIMIYG